MIAETLAPLLQPGLTGPGRWVALLDGGSGSGKTSTAHELARLLDPAPRVVSLDDCYPGWDGLAAGAAMVTADILSDRAGYRRWDWDRNRPGEWVPLDPAADLIIEGCGAITRASVALASVSVWLELSEPVRRQRALARDGAAYEPHWERWAAQERRHWLQDRPRDLADLVIELD
ncbi:cobalt ABC transporter [Enemella evansiae]|uniref:cobalt ABC transporter n=1 Tax=Enemella evansiae TaxID=2016499 RepID=UPI001E576F9E|nr:cobalt ABC transporter [Enemella evansiae]